MKNVKSIKPISANFIPEYNETPDLEPFRFWCQKVLPLVYDDSLSYYELLCKVVTFLNTTIEAMDKTTENMQNIYKAFTQLQEWINIYFDNLDVQEEVNNKIDDMFNSGIFDELISNYFNNTALIFNSVEDMKVSKLLNNGNTAITLGYYKSNDGGSSTYIIETSPSNVSIKLNNGLYANLIIGKYIVPEQLGAYGDGVHDDTNAFQLAISINNSIHLSSKEYLINNLQFNKSVFIKGNGKLSKLKINNSITSDSDSTHTIQLFDLQIIYSGVHGNGISIIKTNDGNAKPLLTIKNVLFTYHNNISSEMDSTFLYLKGIRESSILNCDFVGDSRNYGTFIKMSGDKTHITTNNIVDSCNFTNARTCINLTTDYNNTVYLAGMRILNNTLIGCYGGIICDCNDTIYIHDNMIDYVDNPISLNTCSSVSILNNYLQSRIATPIINITNKSTPNERRFFDIQGNRLWSTDYNTLTVGISFKNESSSSSAYAFGNISNNIGEALHTMVYLEKCRMFNISNNIFTQGIIFCNLHNDTILSNLFDNRCDASVKTIFTNIHPSCDTSEGNTIGGKVSSYMTAKELVGNGVTKKFTFTHSLYQRPKSVIGTTNKLLGNYSLTYDDNNIILEFEKAPSIAFILYYYCK